MLTDKTPDSLLLVDDTPANLTLLSQILRHKGYQLRAVTSGDRALASVDLNPPDLVLLDIRMPEMDGYEVCRRLKANPKLADIPVIFISALDDIEDKVRATRRRSGCAARRASHARACPSSGCRWASWKTRPGSE